MVEKFINIINDVPSLKIDKDDNSGFIVGELSSNWAAKDLMLQEDSWRKTTGLSTERDHVMKVLHSSPVMDVGHTVVSTMCYYGGGVCYCDVSVYCGVLLTQRGLGVCMREYPRCTACHRVQSPTHGQGDSWLLILKVHQAAPPV